MVVYSIKCNLLDKRGVDNWISWTAKSPEENVKTILFNVPVRFLVCC